MQIQIKFFDIILHSYGLVMTCAGDQSKACWSLPSELKTWIYGKEKAFTSQ